MSNTKTLHIGMSLAPTWLSGEAWRRPDSNIEGLLSSDYYLDIAKRAEAVKLDFVFRPDTLFLHPKMLESGPGFGSLDPTILLAAIARETSHIGLLSTVSTTFYPPYVVARQIQSLNWLSNGRAGWNIVTALDGHENFGLPEMPTPEERYARAAEFTDVVRHLWQSFPEAAIRCDRAAGIGTDPSLIRAIDHEGGCFSVKGPLNLPSFDKAPVPLVQAGASPIGRDFAASIADAIFAATPDKEAAIELRKDLRTRGEAHGRAADAVKVLPGLSLYLGNTRGQARDLFAATHAGAERARKLATILEMTGLDLRDWPDDRSVTAADLSAPLEYVRSRTHSELLRRLIVREEPKVADLLMRPEVMGSSHWQVIGTVDDAVAEISDWAASRAMDGFIAVPGGSVECMHRTLDEVIPRLSEAGLFRKDYCGTTFADHLAQ
ncbi:FMN-dependent oxidoreductase (nitrilotriacetate monooxygenase family) [Breoghania corrubedonensis]|uniref:FMN-dependent oxidoreductase (Nitrilotriacetate monooxygenase family) n=1 Tax=Breoghania corrubedonensis TaxID=665038 RepID=A0A2T5UYI4_9HYPH|nr:NtaA/DmoA family FMN-dependent monooxygenase [Breoghania corrubedonensis]PTW56560.1 FMN-dependent oxidoreductase (nitrilotriacetate monooxygenase family) [Breoghania corrubedonensis]